MHLSHAIPVYWSRTPGKAPPNVRVSVADALYLRRSGQAHSIHRGRALRMLAAAAELKPSPTRVVVRGPSCRIGDRRFHAAAIFGAAGVGAHNWPLPRRGVLPSILKNVEDAALRPLLPPGKGAKHRGKGATKMSKRAMKNCKGALAKGQWGHEKGQGAQWQQLVARG